MVGGKEVPGSGFRVPRFRGSVQGSGFGSGFGVRGSGFGVSRFQQNDMRIVTRLILILAGICVLAPGSFVAAPVEQAAVRITKDPQGYWFTEGDTKVLFYQAERKALPDGQAARSNYFHPLYDLDGNVLTEDFPKDHIHHRGIFWAWHQVRIKGTTVQDQWVNRDSFWTVQDAQIASDAGSASLALRVVWESPQFIDAGGRRRPFVEERSVTRVHRAEAAIRKID